MRGPLVAHDEPRARPVADLPLDSLIEHADELARRWAIALIRSRPLASLGEIPLAELARDAPKLLTQALRAMHSDIELDRLTGAGEPGARDAAAPALGLASTAGAHDSGAAVSAVEAMRGVLWEAMLDELRQPAVRHVSDIADRLAYVCARALAATLPASAATLPAPAMQPAPDRGDAGGAPSERSASGRAKRSEAVIIDERAALPSDSRTPRRASSTDVAGAHRPAAERPLSWDESPPVRPAKSAPEIEIRDERGEQGPAAWIRAIGRELARFERDQRPFAVLLVEPREIEELRSEHTPGELARVAALIEGALEHEIQARGSGSLTRELSGRYWLLAPGTDRAGVQALAERARRAVAAAVSYRDRPLQVIVGTAICPDDGCDAPALAAQADIEIYAARSSAARNGAQRSSLLTSLRSAREGGHS